MSQFESQQSQTNADASTSYKFEVENLVKVLNGRAVLNGINLQIKTGESMVVIGTSGTGKSVLLKNLASLMTPTSGEVKFDGHSILNLHSKARDSFLAKIGFLFQGSALFDSLNIAENVGFRLLQRHLLPRKQVMELVAHNLELVGLGPEVMSLYPAELSGGMQKRAAMARVIISKPEVIFFDEPTTGLDPIMSNTINDLMIKVSKLTSATTITITHDMHSVRKIADRVAMLDAGHIVWCGTVAEMEHTDNLHIQQFIQGNTEGPIKILG